MKAHQQQTSLIKATGSGLDLVGGLVSATKMDGGVLKTYAGKIIRVRKLNQPTKEGYTHRIWYS